MCKTLSWRSLWGEGGNGIGKPARRSPSIKQQLEAEIRFFLALPSAEDVFAIFRNIFAIGRMESKVCQRRGSWDLVLFCPSRLRSVQPWSMKWLPLFAQNSYMLVSLYFQQQKIHFRKGQGKPCQDFVSYPHITSAALGKEGVRQLLRWLLTRGASESPWNWLT